MTVTMRPGDGITGNAASESAGARDIPPIPSEAGSPFELCDHRIKRTVLIIRGAVEA